MEAEAVGMVFLTLVTIVSGIGVLVKPILDLNKTIAKLNSIIENMEKRNAERDRRLDSHGDKIDRLESMTTEHEVRIRHLEDCCREVKK